MSKIIGMICTTIACLNLIADAYAFNPKIDADQMMSTKKLRVASCMNTSQFFKFRNHYILKNNGGLYINSITINTDSSIQYDFPDLGWKFLPHGDTEVIKNTYTAVNEAVMTGEVNKYEAPGGEVKLVESLCEVVLSCQCSDAGCFSGIETNGVRCTLDSHGDGSEQDPFIVLLDMKKDMGVK